MSETPTLRDEPRSVPVVSSERVFTGRVWSVVREGFAWGDAAPVREFVAHPGAVAVLAVDVDERVLLIRQYRHPVGLDEWELPAGLLDVPGEEPLAAAQRELAEEVDLEATEWDHLVSSHTTPGGSSERITIFLARGLRPTGSLFARTDEEAAIVCAWLPVDEVVDAILEGRIENGILQTGVLSYHARRDRELRNRAAR